MKKRWKVFWILCGVILGVGVVFCAVGTMLGATVYEVGGELKDGIVIGDGGIFGAWSLQNRGDQEDEGDGGYEYEENQGDHETRECYQKIRELEIEVSCVELQILPSEDENVYVETEGVTSRWEYRCEQKEHTLEIATTSEPRVMNRNKGVIWVYLPADQLEEIDISNKAGATYIKDADAREFKVSVGAGEGVIENFTAHEAELACGAGQMTAEGTALSHMEIECGIGEADVTLVGNEGDFKCEVDCGVGSVRIGERYFEGVGIEHHREGHGDKKLSVDCGMGSVSVSFQ